MLRLIFITNITSNLKHTFVYNYDHKKNPHHKLAGMVDRIHNGIYGAGE